MHEDDDDDADEKEGQKLSKTFDDFHIVILNQFKWILSSIW